VGEVVSERSSAAPAPIELEHVYFSYGPTPVLEDVSLAVAPRDFACLVGPNGGGKTTLLKLVLGLLAPTRGQVRLFGRRPAEARRRAGYMPQRTQLDPQFPVTVLEVVLMGRLGNGWRSGPFGRGERAAALEALEEVGLAELRKRSFAALSGGQRQRVLIARALAAKPEMLLLDEPTANLDPHVEDEFYGLLRRLNERLTIVLVSHDLGVVSQFVKSVICVNGRVQVHPTSALTGELVREVYGHDIELIRHDHRCAEAGHSHD